MILKSFSCLESKSLEWVDPRASWPMRSWTGVPSANRNLVGWERAAFEAKGSVDSRPSLGIARVRSSLSGLS